MKKKDLRISLIQSKLNWENIQSNLDMFSHKIDSIKAGSSDLIILPEMFSTGFSMNTKSLAVETDHYTFEWMQALASLKKCAVCGSVMIKEDDQYYNRFVFVDEKGKKMFYDKKHLFRMGNEHKHYASGTKNIVIKYKGWNIRPMICYDLRFPAWSYNRILKKTNTLEFDVLIYVANWPERRSEAWSQLLIARAIENQCFVAGVNRIGKDGNGVEHSGNSAVIDPLGKQISKTKANKESIETVILSAKLIDTWRKQFPVFMDADEIKIQ